MSFQAEVREGIQWATQAEHEAVTLELGWIDPPRSGADQAGFTLVTPRVLYDRGTLLGQAEILGTRLVPPHVALARTDAQALGISKGDPVLVSTDGTSVTLPAHVNGLVPQGVVAIPHNLEGRPAESLLGEVRTFGQVQVTIKR
jgi:anaerobic selenocysteine-containing dehydrogenase